MKTELTTEQANKLIQCGISPRKAGMVRLDFNGTYAYVYGEETQTVRDCVNGQFYVEESRIFTLNDLFSLLPERKAFANAEAYLNIYFELAGHRWVAQYLDYDKDDDVIGEESAPELIDALYSLCLWGVKRGYVEILKKN
jgi:hypothetical protein